VILPQRGGEILAAGLFRRDGAAPGDPDLARDGEQGQRQGYATPIGAAEIRVPPAMAAGVSDRLWEVSDIVALLEAAEPKPAKRGPYKKRR
jgi:hypothetical protein